MATRPLYRTRPEQEVRTARRRSELYAILTTAAMARGHHDSAAAWLERLEGGAWTPSAYETVADVRLSLGDSLGAAAMIARVVADPYYASAVRRATGLQLVDTATWDSLVTSATARMLEETMAEATAIELPDWIPVVTASGMASDLRGVLSPEGSVVVFSWGACDRCLQRVREFAEAMALLPFSTRLILIVDTRGALDSIPAEWPIDAVALADPWKAASRALHHWGTPETFVVDGHGMLRFRHGDAPELPRQLMAARLIPTIS